MQYKEKAKAPREKRFFTRFYLTEKQTRRVGLAAQSISGVTSAVAVFALLGGLDAPAYSWRWGLAAIAGGAAAWLFQVVGVRAYLVRIIRQATRREWGNWKWATMAALNLIFFAAIFTADLSTSLMARRVLLPQESEASAAAAADSAAILSASAVAIGEREAALAAAIAEIKSTTAAATQAAQQRAAEAVLELEKMKWGDASPAQINTAKSKIAQRQEDLRREIEALETDAQTQIHALKAGHADWLQTHKAANAASLSAISATAEGAGGFAVAAWGFLTLIMYIAAGIAVLAILYEEIYFAGSEVDFQTVEDPKENLIALLFEGLYDRIYYALEGLILSIITPKVPRPKPASQPVPQPRPMGFFSAPAPAQNVVTQKDTTVQPPTARAQYEAAQAAYLEMIREARPNTIKSWYDRSHLAPESRAATPEAQARNAAKYEAIKAKYQPRGVQFIEGKTLTIKY